MSSEVLQRFMNSTSFPEQFSIAKEVHENMSKNPFITISSPIPNIVNNNVFSPSVNVTQEQTVSVVVTIP